MAVPYMRSNIVPVNCAPVCPSVSQVLNAEEKRRVLLNCGSQSTLIADALLLAYDKVDTGASDDSTDPADYQRCGKMLFVVELLRKLEQQNKSNIKITILTANQDLETALLNCLSHLSASQVVRLSSLPLSGASWVGGAFVHIRPPSNQQLSHVTHSDMVLTYDADMVGEREALALQAIPFDCNPAILHLCSIGTPEHGFLSYFH